jgi:excisionase family DNA binding protein
MEDKIFDLKEAAHYLGIKEQTAYRLAQQGKLPAIKIGGLWKIKKEHLDFMFNKNLEEKLKLILR